RADGRHTTARRSADERQGGGEPVRSVSESFPFIVSGLPPDSVPDPSSRQTAAVSRPDPDFRQRPGEEAGRLLARPFASPRRRGRVSGGGGDRGQPARPSRRRQSWLGFSGASAPVTSGVFPARSVGRTLS